VVLGISGGLDSTLALLVVEEAFTRLGYGKDGIHAFTMPGFGTSRRTKGNAGALCEGLGIGLGTVDIRPACRRHFKDIGHDGKTADITYENVQARMRTLVLMNKANMTGGIVIGTGDMSEIALGWCTYNGDHMSMFAVNNGVPKTVVRKVCRWWAERNPGRAAEAVMDIIATPVSPELVRGQVTEDKIGPYELHDFFLWNFIVNEMGGADLKKAALSRFGKKYSVQTVESTLAVFMRRFFTQAFKRNCQPDGIRVFPFELSLRGWWIPSDLGFVEKVMRTS
jgi:NAD+ synthase (glutamine-hydrolysing)